jgi:hypothetical protein
VLVASLVTLLVIALLVAFDCLCCQAMSSKTELRSLELVFVLVLGSSQVMTSTRAEKKARAKQRGRAVVAFRRVCVLSLFKNRKRTDKSAPAKMSQ